MIGLSSTCCPSDLVLFTGYAPASLVAFGGWIVSIVAVGPWGRTLQTCWLWCLRSRPVLLVVRMDSRCVVSGRHPGHQCKQMFSVLMSAKNCSIMCWNVRGLNDGAKRATVRNQIFSTGATMVCLQQTKIASQNHNLLVETVGPDMANNAMWLQRYSGSSFRQVFQDKSAIFNNQHSIITD